MGRIKEHPGYVLVRHFLKRYFDTEADSGEMRAGVPALLGFSAAPGLVVCALLLEKYSTVMAFLKGVYVLDRDTYTLPDKYIFLTLAFAISGLATVLKWDSLFPDRDDYMILAPLPVSPVAIFAAKFVSLALFVIVFATAVNIAGALLFPAIVLGSTGDFPFLLRYLFAHLAASLAASLAGALFVIACAGILLNLLPAGAMRRVSSWLQFGFLVLFLAQIALAPQITDGLLEFYARSDWTLWLFPPMWFVGLYEHFLGRTTLDLSWCVEACRVALVTCAAVSVLTYIASFFRHFRKTAEVSEAGVAPGRTWSLLPAPREPREAAVVNFVKQTISRSRAHRFVLRLFLGLACAVIVQALVGRFLLHLPASRGAAPMELSSPLVVSFFLLTGLRFLLEIPANRQASWAFHVALDETAVQPMLRGVRRVLTEIGVVAWLLVITPVNVALLGPEAGVAHSVFCLLVSLIFLEALLFTYRKVPFACAMSEDRTYIGLVLSAAPAVFLFYAYALTAVEASLLHRPVHFAIAMVFLAGVWSYMRIRKKEWAALNTPLDLAGGTPPVVMTLDLQR